MKGFIRKSLFVGFTVIALFISLGIDSVVFAQEAKLPVVQKWVNGAALSSDGSFLRDTWAIDETGLSEIKYVLINQESTEVFRVNNYPDDISGGETITIPIYTVDIQLTVPETLKGEVNLTLENDASVYTVSFNESNEYKGSMGFYPGQYSLTDVEITDGSEDSYKFSESLSLMVDSENVSVSWELQNVSVNEETLTTTISKEKDVDVEGIVKGFDTDGDLFSDTVILVVAVIVLFIAYGIVKYRRKKKEEINS